MDTSSMEVTVKIEEDEVKVEPVDYGETNLSGSMHAGFANSNRERTFTSVRREALINPPSEDVLPLIGNTCGSESEAGIEIAASPQKLSQSQLELEMTRNCTASGHAPSSPGSFPLTTHLTNQKSSPDILKSSPRFAIRSSNFEDSVCSDIKQSDDNQTEVTNALLPPTSILNTQKGQTDIPFGVKPFQCDLCDLSYNQESSLNRHKKVHSDTVVSERSQILVAEIPSKSRLARKQSENVFSTSNDSVTSSSGTNSVNIDKNRGGNDRGKAKKLQMAIRDGQDKPLGTGRYRCRICNRRYKFLRSLQRHRNKHHQSLPTGLRFANKQAEIEEKMTKKSLGVSVMEKPAQVEEKPKIERSFEVQSVSTGNGRFECADCGASYANRTALDEHERKHTGELPFACSYCGSRFARGFSLARHEMSHVRKGGFLCRHCNVRFRNARMLKVHVTRKHTKRATEESLERNVDLTRSKVKARSTRLVTNRKASVVTFSCVICRMKFTSKRNLHAHRSKKPIVCPQCPVRCCNVTGLAKHMSTHSVSKAFSCNFCNVQCARSSNLTVHMNRKHSDKLSGNENTFVGSNERPGRGPTPFVDASDFTKHQNRLVVKKHSPATLNCKKCDAVFPDVSELERHEKEHVADRPFACTLCNISFCEISELQDHHNDFHLGNDGSGSKLQAHRDSALLQKTSFVTSKDVPSLDEDTLKDVAERQCLNPSVKRFSCSFCDDRFFRRFSLKQHMRKHVGSKPFFCKKCPNRFKDLASLKEHRSKHSAFRCSNCNLGLVSLKCLRQHQAKYCKQKATLKNGIEDSSITLKHAQLDEPATQKSNVSSQAVSSSAPKDLKDNLWNDNVASVAEKRNVTNGKGFRCSVCDYRFSQRSNLKRHMLKHVGSKPFFCNKCPIRFADLTGLTEHRRKHSAFRCRDCKAGFSCSKFLQVHVNKRCKKKSRAKNGGKANSLTLKLAKLGEPVKSSSNVSLHTVSSLFPKDSDSSQKRIEAKKEFSCDVCAATFSEHRYLAVHKKRHQGKRPHFCRVCCARFRNVVSLRLHMQKHEETRLECDECDAVFYRKESLQRHQRRKHLTDDNFVCSICHSRYKSMHELSVHQKTHAEKNSKVAKSESVYQSTFFVCTDCFAPFVSRNELDKHKLSKGHGKQPRGSPKTETSETSSPKKCPEARAIGKSSKKFKPTSSITETRQTRDSEEPQKVLSPVKPYVCSDCGLCFPIPSKLKRHKQSHSSERKYVCELCGALFKDITAVKNHKARIHTGDVRFVCDICSAAFNQQAALTTHKKMH